MAQYAVAAPRLHTQASTEFKISVRSMSNYDLNGQIYHSMTRCVWLFSSVFELLDILKQQIDLHGAIKPTVRERSWNAGNVLFVQKLGGTNMPPNGNPNDITSGAPSFLVRVHYCQGATWQGTIQWLNTESTASFRSTLELIHLMEEAVTKQLPSNTREKERGWNAV